MKDVLKSENLGKFHGQPSLLAMSKIRFASKVYGNDVVVGWCQTGLQTLGNGGPTVKSDYRKVALTKGRNVSFVKLTRTHGQGCGA